jgi:hypothetical protein
MAFCKSVFAKVVGQTTQVNNSIINGILIDFIFLLLRVNKTIAEKLLLHSLLSILCRCFTGYFFEKGIESGLAVKAGIFKNSLNSLSHIIGVF